MANVNIKIDGMSCMHCVMRVKQALSSLAGVGKADVTVGNASVDFDDAKVSAAEIEAAITKSGYKVVKG